MSSGPTQLLAGIDLGTSFFKLGLFDRTGQLRGLARSAVPAETQDGRCELGVEPFWATLASLLSEALRQAGAGPESIAAVSYSSQANSFILMDGDDQPLTPLILWPDGRARGHTQPLEWLWGLVNFAEVTGIGISPTHEFAAGKLAWFRRGQPDLWSRVRRVKTISDYLVWGLTGRHGGDQATASLLGLWDVRGQQWWPAAIDLIGLDRAWLSTLAPPGTHLGPICADGAGRLGLPAGTPLAAGTLDHHAAAIGAGLAGPGELSVSLGTVLACVQLDDAYRPLAGCCVGPGTAGGYYRLAFHSDGVGLIDWYQRNFAPQLTVADLLDLASDVPADCDGLQALPNVREHHGLTGLTGRRPTHGHGHFARALATQVAGNLAVLVGKLCDGGRPHRVIATGGGTRHPLWLELASEALGVAVTASDYPEPACRGAAILASMA